MDIIIRSNTNIFRHFDTLLFDRFRTHFSDIRHKDALKPVSKHFSTNDHTIDDVKIIGITKTTANNNYCLWLEESWIHELQTYKPLGLNIKQWNTMARTKTTSRKISTVTTTNKIPCDKWHCQFNRIQLLKRHY